MTSPSGPDPCSDRTHRSGLVVRTRPRCDGPQRGRTAGWGAGARALESLAETVPRLRAALVEAGRDPDAFPVSKRVFVSVHEDRDVARSEIDRWFHDVYRDPSGTDRFGVYETPAEVRRQLEQLAATARRTCC